MKYRMTWAMFVVVALAGCAASGDATEDDLPVGKLIVQLEGAVCVAHFGGMRTTFVLTDVHGTHAIYGVPVVSEGRCLVGVYDAHP